MTDSSVEAVARAKELAEVTDLAKFASRREQQFFRERNALIVALKQIKIKAIKIADKDYSDPRMLKLQSEIREIIDEVLASSPDKPLDDKQIMRELQPSREVQDRIRREQEANAVGAHAVQNMPFGSCDKGMPCPGQRSDGRPVYCSPECAARAALPSPEREPMRDAAQALIDHASSTYTARNGRKVGIQGDDGEMCWIVHSDDFEALRRALAPPTAQSEKVK